MGVGKKREGAREGARVREREGKHQGGRRLMWRGDKGLRGVLSCVGAWCEGAWVRAHGGTKISVAEHQHSAAGGASAGCSVALSMYTTAG